MQTSVDLLTSHLLPQLDCPQDLVCFRRVFVKCVWICCPVAVVLLEYSKECWGGGCVAIWSLLPALHNKNRHTSTPVMDDKETGTEEVVRGGGRRKQAGPVQ